MTTDILKSGRCRIVGIAEMLVTDKPDEVLVTYSLGSCIGVAAWDSEAGVAGLIHCLLPSSRSSQDGGSAEPARFVDAGMVEFLRELFEAGARRDSLVIKVAGGASPLQDCEGFRIGERNQAALRKVLWKNKLLAAAERVGGTEPRTLAVRASDGRTVVRSKHQEEEI